MIELRHDYLGRIEAMKLKLDTIRNMTSELIGMSEVEIARAIEKYSELDKNFENTLYHLGRLQGFLKEI